MRDWIWGRTIAGNKTQSKSGPIALSQNKRLKVNELLNAL